MIDAVAITQVNAFNDSEAANLLNNKTTAVFKREWLD